MSREQPTQEEIASMLALADKENKEIIYLKKSRVDKIGLAKDEAQAIQLKLENLSTSDNQIDIKEQLAEIFEQFKELVARVEELQSEDEEEEEDLHPDEQEYPYPVKKTLFGVKIPDDD